MTHYFDICNSFCLPDCHKLSFDVKTDGMMTNSAMNCDNPEMRKVVSKSEGSSEFDQYAWIYGKINKWQLVKLLLSNELVVNVCALFVLDMHI